MQYLVLNNLVVLGMCFRSKMQEREKGAGDEVWFICSLGNKMQGVGTGVEAWSV